MSIASHWAVMARSSHPASIDALPERRSFRLARTSIVVAPSATKVKLRLLATIRQSFVLFAERLLAHCLLDAPKVGHHVDELQYGTNLADPASRHVVFSRITPCMSQ
jgi:hypothetical protein